MPITPTPVDADGVRRFGTVAVVLHVVALCGLGLCSVPGLWFAVRARRLAATGSPGDLAEAGRALRWSWLLLAANLLLWLLLLVLIGIVVLAVLAGSV